MQTDTDSLHQTPQSDPDSQTDLLQDRNNASGYSAARSLHHNTAFTVFGVVKDLSKRFVAVGIDVDIGISAVRVDILTNISLSLAIFFSWVFKSSYKLQIIVKFI